MPPPGRRALFTDPVVVTGPVTHEELALRGSIGHFLFVPPGFNERLIEEAGMRLVWQEDVSGERRLSRIAYLVEKPGAGAAGTT